MGFWENISVSRSYWQTYTAKYTSSGLCVLHFNTVTELMDNNNNKSLQSSGRQIMSVTLTKKDEKVTAPRHHNSPEAGLFRLFLFSFLSFFFFFGGGDVYTVGTMSDHVTSSYKRISDFTEPSCQNGPKTPPGTLIITVQSFRCSYFSHNFLQCISLPKQTFWLLNA